MNRHTRRSIIAGAPAAMLSFLLLSGCAPGSAEATTLAMVQAYLPGLAGAFVAGGNAYTGPDADTVRQLVAQLQTGANDFANLGDVSTARSAALSLISMMQQLMPLLKGPNGQSLIPTAAAPYIPMGLAVLQAFISALPPPPSAPATPPAGLSVQKAALRRR